MCMSLYSLLPWLSLRKLTSKKHDEHFLFLFLSYSAQSAMSLTARAALMTQMVLTASTILMTLFHHLYTHKADVAIAIISISFTCDFFCWFSVFCRNYFKGVCTSG